MDSKKAMMLHESGLSVTQIAGRLKVEPESVRAIILTAWEKDKRRSGIQGKVAGRRGR